MLGHWSPWKRADLFINAAGIAFVQNPQLYFVLWGRPAPGQRRDLSERYSEQLQGVGEVRDWTPDTPQVFSALDILVHPSGGEAFGRVVAEAMSCEVPVVGARGGGVGEIVRHGETGLIVSPDNSPAFAGAILDLSRDAARRQAMGREGRRRIVEQFSAELHARAIERVYERLLRE